MKRFLAIALVVGTAYVGVARGQTVAAQSDVAKADLALTQALVSGDRAAADKMLDAEFSWIDPDGVYYATKAEAFRAGVKPLVGTPPAPAPAVPAGLRRSRRNSDQSQRQILHESLQTIRNCVTEEAILPSTPNEEVPTEAKRRNRQGCHLRQIRPPAVRRACREASAIARSDRAMIRDLGKQG